MTINAVYNADCWRSGPRSGSTFRVADNAPEATLRRLPKEHCTGSAGE
jgi:hypothetical protein